MFGALAFDLDSVATLRLCSWRDNGWRALLIRSYANDPVAEEVLLPATAEQTLVLITSGTKTIESRAGARWHSAEYGPGRIGMTAPHQEAHLRWRGAATTSTNVYLPAGLLERTAAELFGRGASRVSRPDALAADDPVLAAVLTGLGDAALAGRTSCTRRRRPRSSPRTCSPGTPRRRNRLRCAPRTSGCGRPSRSSTTTTTCR